MVKTGGSRVASIDALRAITMMLMLFVNDIPGLKGVPHWLFHARADEDMLGFSDTIFPAFLFCVGMSVPFAIEQRLRKGDSPLRVLAHILWRGVALIVMGVFTYNLERDLSCISYLWFSLLMIAGFFLIWTDYRHTILSDKPVLTNLLKALGISILVGMMMWCHYCGECFETGWWGILGLIGWSYLVTSLIYLVCRRALVRAQRMVGARALYRRTVSLTIDEVFQAEGGAYTTHHRVLGYRLRDACCRHRLASLLDHFQDTGHPDMGILLSGDLFPSGIPSLLADGCKGAHGMDMADSTCRNGYAYMLSVTLRVVSCERCVRSMSP